MSIIVTHLSQLGIIHATDSNITENGGVRDGEKLFELPKLKAALTIAGNYVMQGVYFNKWIKEYIGHDKSPTLNDFVKTLTTSLAIVKENELQIMHIAGYESEGANLVPRFYCIRNYETSPDTGEPQPHNTYSYSWSEDYKWSPGKEQNEQYYFNGILGGLKLFKGELEKNIPYRKKLWAESTTFRRPNKIEEMEMFVKTDVAAVCALYNSTDNPPAIGGKIQTYLIPKP